MGRRGGGCGDYTATESIDARITQTNERYNNIMESGCDDEDVNQGTFKFYIIIVVVVVLRYYNIIILIFI